jgi:hypothetical protein
MVTRSLRLAFGAILAASVALGVAACDKMPLVAPSGTVINLYANSTVLPVEGSIEITAIAIMGGAATTTTTPTTGTTPTAAPATASQGTPVHNGTVISFTTTLGRIEPQEAATHNGQVTVKLVGGGSSGVATVRAFSGGASSNELKVNVGAAAAGRLDLVANPTTLPSSGGVSNLVARVFDTNGNPLASVPVSFSVETGGGTFTNSTVVTDSSGNAATSFSTNRETTVVATAGIGASGGTGGTSTPLTAKVTIRVNTASTLTISSTTTAPVQNQPVNFTITPGGGASTGTNVIRNVVVDFGDGARFTLGNVSGATTVSHVYANSGTFQVTASGLDINGETAAAATIVAVTEQLPLAVTLSAAPSTARRGVDTVTFTASVSGGSPISYEWDFGDGTTASTTGASTSHFYSALTPLGPVQVKVRVLSNNAGEGRGETTVIITTP